MLRPSNSDPTVIRSKDGSVMLAPDIDKASRAFAAWLGSDLTRLDEIVEVYKRIATENPTDIPRLLADAYRAKSTALEQAGVDVDKVPWKLVAGAIGRLAAIR